MQISLGLGPCVALTAFRSGTLRAPSQTDGFRVQQTTLGPMSIDNTYIGPSCLEFMHEEYLLHSLQALEMHAEAQNPEP